MSLNLHLLRLFATVAAHGNFSRAAEALHLSQPALSKGVRQFEAQIGAELLERGQRKIRPTAAGERLLRHAQTLFAAERAAEEELAALRGLRSGALSVGASMTVASYYLPPVLARYHTAHPGIDLKLVSANTAEIAELLQARALDIALIEGPSPAADLIVTPWGSDRLSLIAAPDHPLAQPHPPPLAEACFILREPGSGTRQVVLDVLAGVGITPRRTLEAGSNEAVLQLVAVGLGVAILSKIAAEPQLTLGRLIEIPLSGPLWHPSLIRPLNICRAARQCGGRSF